MSAAGVQLLEIARVATLKAYVEVVADHLIHTQTGLPTVDPVMIIVVAGIAGIEQPVCRVNGREPLALLIHYVADLAVDESRRSDQHTASQCERPLFEGFVLGEAGPVNPLDFIGSPQEGYFRPKNEAAEIEIDPRRAAKGKFAMMSAIGAELIITNLPLDAEATERLCISLAAHSNNQSKRS